MINWWQVYYFDYERDKICCFGFCSINGVVTDHPEYKYKNLALNKYKPYLLKLPHVQVIQVV